MSKEPGPGTLRRRNDRNTLLTEQETKENEAEPSLTSNNDDQNDKKKDQHQKTRNNKKINTTYWMTTLLILRSIALIYFIAFCVAYFQNNALIGINGIYPYTTVLHRYEAHYKTNWDKYVNLPTLLWFMPHSNESIQQIALCGMILSLSVLIFGYRLCHIVIFLSLWLLYHSLVNVGGLFYGYGWESQVLETGFLAIFLCRIRIIPWKYPLNKSSDNINPHLSMKGRPAIPPSYLILYLYLWLSFRIMIGAGMIKIRAGQCWLDYTCMDYHYETQPNPNPLSWIMHNNPHYFHVFEVGTNHFVELIGPWFLLIPIRKVTLIAGLIQILFQFLIVFSGNLSFLNWLTMIPALAAFDDTFCYHYLYFLFTKRERQYLYNECASYYIQYFKHQNNIEIQRSLIVNESSVSSWLKLLKCWNIFSFPDLLYKLLCVLVVILIGHLSVDVVSNLLSKGQIMNTSFDAFRVVNTYGAFGTVGKERFEVIFSMTNDEYIDEDTKWIEIVFKCKPGPLDRRPCLITPYHYRLDWQIWFAGFHPHTPNRHPWIFLFIAQLLSKDKDTIQLLDECNNINNITYIKADMFKYQFTDKWTDKNWWKRQIQSEYLPPLNIENKQFQNILNQLSWTGHKNKKQNTKKRKKKKSKRKNKERKEL